MPNRYFNNAIDLINNTRARASDVEANFDQIEDAFDAAQVDIDAKANSVDSALTGTPTAPTAAPGTNTSQIATTAFVHAERDNAATLTNKTINLANNTLVATSAQLAAAVTDETGSGQVVFNTSPALGGTPTAPTAPAGTNTTQLATTAFVGGAIVDERSAVATLTNKTLTDPVISGGSITGTSINGTASISIQRFSGNGVTTAFTLTNNPFSENNTQVYINGVYQNKDTYSVSGTTLTFSEAPHSGTDNIEVASIATQQIGATSSDLVSYSPAGTGAVASNVQSKLREFVSVKDFGAVGDGVTDNAAAFQSAIAAAAGRHIYIPAGTYRINAGLDYTTTGLGIVSGLKFIGDGKYKTILDNASGEPLIACTSGTSNTDFQYDVFIENLSIINSTASANTIGILLIGVFQSVIRNVRIVDQDSHGIYMNSTVGDATDCSQISIDLCDLSENGGWGFLAEASPNAIHSNITLDKCRVVNNTSGGVGFYSVIQGVIQNSAIAYNGGIGVVVSHAGGPYSKNVRIINNEFDSNTGTQLELGYVTGTIADDNYFVCNTGAPTVTKQINVTQYAQNTLITHSYPRLPSGYTGVTMFAIASGAVTTRIINTLWQSWEASGNTKYSDSGTYTDIIDDNELTTSRLIKINGGGVQFPATQVPSANANTLDDYEEGVWTPVDNSGAGILLLGASGYYTKIGRLVTVSGAWTFDSNADGSNISIGGLPFTIGQNSAGALLQSSANAGDTYLLPTGTASIFVYGASLTRRTNANYSSVAVYFSGSYIV